MIPAAVLLLSCRVSLFVLRLFSNTWLSFICRFHKVAESHLRLSAVSHRNPDGHAGSPLQTNTVIPTKRKDAMTALNPQKVYFLLTKPGQDLHTETPEQFGSGHAASRSLYTELDWLEAGEWLPWCDGRGCQSKGSRDGCTETTAWGDQKGGTGRENGFRCVRQSSQYPITDGHLLFKTFTLSMQK